MTLDLHGCLSIVRLPLPILRQFTLALDSQALCCSTAVASILDDLRRENYDIAFAVQVGSKLSQFGCCCACRSIDINTTNITPTVTLQCLCRNISRLQLSRSNTAAIITVANPIPDPYVCSRRPAANRRPCPYSLRAGNVPMPGPQAAGATQLGVGVPP